MLDRDIGNLVEVPTFRITWLLGAEAAHQTVFKGFFFLCYKECLMLPQKINRSPFELPEPQRLYWSRVSNADVL